jgi:hypothetical protein
MVPPFPVSLVVKTTFAGIVELFVMHRRTPRFEDSLSTLVDAAASTAVDEPEEEHEVATTAVRIASAPTAVMRVRRVMAILCRAKRRLP